MSTTKRKGEPMQESDDVLSIKFSDAIDAVAQCVDDYRDSPMYAVDHDADWCNMKDGMIVYEVTPVGLTIAMAALMFGRDSGGKVTTPLDLLAEGYITARVCAYMLAIDAILAGQWAMATSNLCEQIERDTREQMIEVLEAIDSPSGYRHLMGDEAHNRWLESIRKIAAALRAIGV